MNVEVLIIVLCPSSLAHWLVGFWSGDSQMFFLFFWSVFCLFFFVFFFFWFFGLFFLFVFFFVFILFLFCFFYLLCYPQLLPEFFS